ncbi:MAG: 50S ribosomal protein L10 [Candidatus Heimdallarchaeota archaeon]|nr:50S ribosomal protein L10 [Candidatus Heimdallarchaeota archaeon]
MTEKKIAKRKLETVAKIKDHLAEYNTVGIVAMESIAAKTVQKLRADLRDKAKIIGAKNTLMRKALEESNVEGSENLIPYVSGSVSFLFTNASPYSIANYLENNKVKAAAKGGQVAPKAVTVPKMNTGQPPGTIISLLNSVGLPTRIEGGTVAIPNDTQVIEVGDVITPTLASILAQLGIEPFEVGLSLDCVLENGEIIEHDDLILDFDALRSELIYAYKAAVSVSLASGYLTSDTAPQVVARAHSNALAVAAEIGYITKETAPRVLGLALARVKALAKALQAVDPSAVPAEIA